MNTTAIVCVAALGLLLFGLGWAISIARFQAKRFYGYESDPTSLLYKLVRSHANTAEYAPFLAVLFLLLGAHGPAPWVVGSMIAATACRFIFVVGMVAFPTLERPNPVRFVGAAGTYGLGLALCVALIQQVRAGAF